MEENLQNQNIVQVAPQPPETNEKKWLKVGLFVVAGLTLLVGSFYTGMRFSARRETTKNLPTPSSTPTNNLPQPSITNDQSQMSEPTSKPGTPIRQITYKKIEEWVEYKSDTGYSIQHPPQFFDADNSGEEWRDGGCMMFFGNNAGGILSAKVVPYSGGSRRQLYGTPEGYDYKFEEVVLQGKNSLLIEAGPIGDSGSGSGIVVPVGNRALILSWSNRGKDSQDFTNLLQSIQVGSSLDLTKCQKTTDEAKFTGFVSNITYGCFNLDGTCEVYVDNKRVIAQIGSTPEKFPQYGQRGQLIDINLNSIEKDRFIGKKVEVFGKINDVNNYTIYGDKKFYIKLLE